MVLVEFNKEFIVNRSHKSKTNEHYKPHCVVLLGPMLIEDLILIIVCLRSSSQYAVSRPRRADCGLGRTSRVSRWSFANEEAAR